MRFPWLKYLQKISSISLITSVAIHEFIQTWGHGLYIDRLEGVGELLLLCVSCERLDAFSEEEAHSFHPIHKGSVMSRNVNYAPKSSLEMLVGVAHALY